MSTIQEGRYTFKVDASCDDEYGISGIGIVIQYSTHPKRPGAVIEKIAECIDDMPSHMAEKYAILKALEIAYTRGYRRVIVRSDANAMRTQLKQDIKEGTGWDRDEIHTQILQYVTHFNEIHIRYQPRRKNHEAHNLAREAVHIGRLSLKNNS